MERLGGLDAAFLALETGTMHLHVGAVMVLEPGDAGAGAARYFDRMRSVVEERIHLVPPFRRRVVRVPFGLHHPVWVEDPRFDLDFHLRRASLPAPGGPHELSALVSDLASRPLDQNSPLWELHLVEGLESGHVAVVPKVHHALFDGASGVEVVGAFLDASPLAPTAPGRPRRWRPETIPTDTELVGAALSSLVHHPERAADTVLRTFGAARMLVERNRRLREEDESMPPPGPFRAPRTSLNGSISAHRRFGFVQVPLEEIRAVRRVFGGTVNDVVLASVAGGLRKLLGRRGERLDESLVAMVPMSTRGVSDAGTLGNRLSAMLVSLATSVADPVERYHSIAASTRLAKEQATVLSEELIRGWAQLAFPAMSSRLAKLAGNLRLFDHLPPLFNVLVSNIVGADVPLWCAGARLVALYPFGPIIEGVGLNVTVASYDGTLYAGILGCRELVPEVAALGDHMTDAFAELAKAAMRDTGHWT
jgi:diacylglycerol O-acyltransferase / wax synthase